MKKLSSLDIRVLRIFEATANSGSLSAASEKLGITQSAISQAINQIEAILQTQVFDRSQRPFKLTPAGIALSRRAKQIVEDMDKLVIHVKDAALTSRPAIRMGMIDSFAATVGPAIVKHATTTASHLLLWSGLANSHATALLNRELDIIVTSDDLIDVDSIIRKPIFSEPFILVVSKNKASEFQGKDLTYLIEHMPFIRFSIRSHFGAMIERYLRRCGYSPRPYLEIDTADVVMAMVAADLGWTIMTPLCLLQGRSYLHQITPLPLPGVGTRRTIYQLSRENEYEDMAELFLQASKNTLETEIFRELRSLLPWLKEQIFLK